jgi:hypothetical protein
LFGADRKSCQHGGSQDDKNEGFHMHSNGSNGEKKLLLKQLKSW